jgi:putative ABC transport system permease protein
MRAVMRQVRAAVLRRRGQTASVLIVSLLASCVATMALTLLVRSTQPYDDAFAQVAGPHLQFLFDASRVTADQLRATESLPGVTAAGPPRQTAVVPFERGTQKGLVELVGRDSPGGAFDRLVVVSGHWPERQGEIAVTSTGDSSIPIQPRTGETIQALTARGTSQFKVVGEVIDVGGGGATVDFSSGIPAAWVLPDDIAPLVDGVNVRLGYEMAYRFARAGTAEELASDRREIEAALPTGAETLPPADWLTMRQGSIWLINMISSIILAFTLFAVAAVAAIVASGVAGSVLSSYRDIGIIKALGFRPVEVVAIYVGQMVMPATIGALAGIPLGALASRPFLDDAANSFRLPEPAIIDPVVDVAVPAALLALVIVAAVLPALRAAATDSIRAMTLGSAPPTARRSRLAAGLRRLGAPRPLTLGAGDAFARPVRALLTVVALGIGIATATFAIGFQDTLVTLLTKDPAAYGYGQDVVVQRYPAISDQQVMARLAEQSETRSVVATQARTIRLSGGTDPYPIYAMRGDASVLGYRAVAGRWFRSSGEAVIGYTTSREAGLHIGDSFTGSLVGGPALRLRVVGLVNDFNTNGRSIRVGWETLAAAVPETAPDTYLVKLKPGADGQSFAHRIAALSPDFLDARPTFIADTSFYTNLVSGMVGALALVLMLIAAVGVFNATLLMTRERVRDIAILKSVGMTSSQIVVMVIGATLVLTVVATVLGVPAGLWLQGVMWGGLATSFGSLITPVLTPASVVAAAAVAFVIALSGAVLPGRWAAGTPVAYVLRSE